MPAKDQLLRALVLSGGGARGAYEVGVLQYLYEHIPQSVWGPQHFRILSGTSVGAIHACFIGANAHAPHKHIRTLAAAWERLRLEKLLRMGLMDILRLPFDVRALLRKKTTHGIILDSDQLLRLVLHDIPWPQLRSNLDARLFDALTVTATHLKSGKSVVFVDQPASSAPLYSRDYRRVAQGVQIGPRHALASAAIPVLFPAVEIGGRYYCDGSIRQNTPLAPALRLGAHKALVISVGHHRNLDLPSVQINHSEDYPGPVLLAGRLLNAFLLDHLDYDLAQLHGINRLLDDGVERYGGDFIDQVSQTARKIRGAAYRRVEALVIQPSRDMGEIAIEFLQDKSVQLAGVPAYLLHKMAQSDPGTSGDLLSYLCFDGRLARRYMALGMQDADARREALIRFFSDEGSC